MFILIYNVLNIIVASSEKDEESSTLEVTYKKSLKRKFKTPEVELKKEEEEDDYSDDDEEPSTSKGIGKKSLKRKSKKPEVELKKDKEEDKEEDDEYDDDDDQNPQMPKLEESKKDDDKFFIIEKHKIGKRLASGGTKKVMTYDGDSVISFLPLNLIKTEMKVIEDLKKLGLHTQNSKIGKLEENGEVSWALIMESWESMQSKGWQIRDSKNEKTKYGTSMVFQTLKNMTVENMLRILIPIMDDCYKLIINGIFLGGDAFNLVIKDTEETDTSDRKECKLYTEREQICGLFFCDFTSLYDYEDWKKSNLKGMFDIEKTKESKLKIKLNKDAVKKNVKYVFEGGCDASVFYAMKEDELKILRKEDKTYVQLFNSVLKQTAEMLIPELTYKCCKYFTEQLKNKEFRKKLK